MRQAHTAFWFLLAPFLFTLAASPGAAQVCTVQKVLGDGNGGNLGSSLASSGDTLLAGAPTSDDNGPQTGAVHVYTRSGTTWSFQERIAGPQMDTRFGEAVSIDGDTALIGAPFDDTSGPVDAGAAYVYVRSGTTWTQEGPALTASVPAAGDLYGSSVAVVGDTALVGYQRDSSAGPASSGSVYVYSRAGTVWSLETVLTASDASANALFGLSVDLEIGAVTRALIGAPKPGGVGAAYVLERAGAPGTAWTEQVKLVAADGATNDFFGRTVALSFLTALVGAPSDDDACPSDPNCNSGSAYVFARTGSTTWPQEAKLTSSDADHGDRFGLARMGLSAAGDEAVIGAPLFDNPSGSHGSAYWYVRTGTVWDQVSKVLPNDGDTTDFFGQAISMAGPLGSAGPQILIGAPLDDDGPVPDAGALYVMESATLVSLLFESAGVVVNESRGTAHTAASSLFSQNDRDFMRIKVQEIFDDGLGQGIVGVLEGTTGCVNVVISSGTSPTSPKYGNAGEERRSAILYEGQFRTNPVYTTDTELALAMAESAAHEIGHKLGLQGHNCNVPPTIMTAGEKVDPSTRKLGLRRFDPIDLTRISFNRRLVTAEPKSGLPDPNDLAILNGSFCVPPALTPEDDYISFQSNFTPMMPGTEFGYMNSLGEFVYQGDSTNNQVIVGSHFDAGFDMALRLPTGEIKSFSQGDGCYDLSNANPNNPAVFTTATVKFDGFATLQMDLLNVGNTNGGLQFPTPGNCGVVSFCTAKTFLVCGPPSIAAAGNSSIVQSSGFTVSASPARTCKSGILLYNSAANVAGAPFEGGTLCLQPMGLRRAGSTNSQGTPGGANCDGEFAVDMNAFALGAWTVPACDGSASGIPPSNPANFLLTPGTAVSVQFWGRDSQGTGSFVSAGLAYVVGP